MGIIQISYYEVYKKEYDLRRSCEKFQKFLDYGGCFHERGLEAKEAKIESAKTSKGSFF
ncbi:MAG: hypothetical protein ACLVIY_04010 [Anaerobutyricum soehngenii]